MKRNNILFGIVTASNDYDKVLKINVVENPIIQSISINGIKNKSILDKLNEITKKSEKYPFLIHKINDQKNLLINIVRTNGFYFATIDTKIKDNKNNSVDLIYNQFGNQSFAV